MKTFTAKIRGRYLSQTVDGRFISIHESTFLEVGDKMKYPDGAFIMMVVESPDHSREDD